MLKVIAVSMVFLLLATSGAWADPDQEQLTGIGLTNTIALLGGDQSASSMQNLVVDNAQFATGICGALAEEYLFAAVGQSGIADGCCGVVDIIGILSVDGLQRQTAGAQIQTLGVVAGQSLGKAEGLGAANALQTLVVNEAQSSGGSMDESATVLGMQTADMFGQPGAINVVDGSMVVATGQSQAAL
jgi:hypothetical protein